MQTLLLRIMANKHTTGAALAFGVCGLISHVGTIWFPGHEVQFHETMNAIKDFCVIYGFALSKDSVKPPPADAASPTGPANPLIKTACLLFGIAGIAVALLMYHK